MLVALAARNHTGEPFWGHQTINHPVYYPAGKRLPQCREWVVVDCRYAGKTVSLRTYADRIVTMAAGKSVGEHVRSFKRDRTFFDPWHYVAALEKKPGALRNGAPFKDWALPPALQEMRQRLCAKSGGPIASS